MTFTYNKYFISFSNYTGKYDQLRQNDPYSALLAAFRNFFDVLLAGDNDVLNYFAKNIKEAVGNEGRLLCNIIENLERVIGVQGKVEGVIGSEAKNRFNYVFCNFIQAICSQKHPIVLELDDLQVNIFDFLLLMSSI